MMNQFKDNKKPPEGGLVTVLLPSGLSSDS